MSKKNIKDSPNISIKLKEIHSSWIQELSYGVLLDKLRKATTMHEAQLLHYISKHLLIDQIDLSNTKGYLQKLHNIKPEELEKVVIKAGVLQLSKPIKQIIDQQDVKKIKQLLGEDLYQLALHDIPSESPTIPILSSSPKILLNSLSPFIEAGMHTLDMVLRDHLNNCFFKLPKSWKENYSSQNLKEFDLREQRLQKKLMSSLMC